jgi:hypothetical protein
MGLHHASEEAGDVGNRKLMVVRAERAESQGESCSPGVKGNLMPDIQSTEEEMLAYWKSLAGDDSSDDWEEDDLAMFFQGFRPHGDGVEAAFEGVVGAEEILPRLMQVYEATADGSEHEGSSDGYFVVRNPRPLSAERAKALAGEDLYKVSAIVSEFAALRPNDSATELQALLDPLPAIEVVRGETPWPPDNDAPEGLIYEVTNDFMHHLKWDRKPVESHAHLLEEALYSLAGDYNLGYHILWPLYRHLTPITEPFEAHFELWKHGAGYRFHSNDQVTVYVPNLVS